MTALAGYLRHADQFGPDGVLDAARGDLDPEQFETLAARLRELIAREGATAHAPAPARRRGTDQGSSPTTARKCDNRGSRECSVCGAALDGYRSHATVCRKASCRQTAHRARRPA